MKKRDVYGYLIGIAAAELVGLLARLFSGAGDAFYSALRQPPLAPPGWVFPVAWALLYAMMGAASYGIWSSAGEGRRCALLLYAVQLAVNFSWTIVFFRFQLVGPAAAVLALLCVLVALTMLCFWRLRRSAGLLMLPYLLWSLFAVPERGGLALKPVKFSPKANEKGALRNERFRAGRPLVLSQAVRSAYPASISAASASGFTRSCTPRCPALTAISSNSTAVSSKYVGNFFFMPTGEQPPRM